MIKRALATLLVAASPALADQPPLDFRLSFDYFQEAQTTILGTAGIGIYYTTDQGYYLGQTVYSAAFGGGGGFFVGGFEAGKYTSIGDTYFVDASIFVGGGGGANQVPGDGLMLRPQMHVGYDFGNFRLGAGASWVSVSGSPISTPAFALNLTRPLNWAVQDGNGSTNYSISGATRFTAMKPFVRTYFPINSEKRYDRGPLQAMYFLGAEFSFTNADNSETFLQASGAVAGDAEGYADWMLGKRYFFGQDNFRLFAEFGAGVGGGGAVDTGGGLIASVGGGLRVDMGANFGTELAVSAVRSLNGDFLALSPTLKVNLAFGSTVNMGLPPNQNRWQLSTGITQQYPNESFRKPGVPNQGSPLMIDTSIDLFITKNLYFTGHGYTALDGEAGGYQIGLVGLGYRIPLNDQFDLSLEAMLGAGGGAGVDTVGGLLMGYRFDFDYKLTDAAYLTVGGGQVRTLMGGGMAPMTLNIGMKFPFTTLH